jgi:hypothetical protein
MSVIGSVAAGMRGALMLARGRPEGVQLVGTDRTAAIRAFWAIPLCLPPVVCMRLLEWAQSRIPANAPLALGRYLLLFLVGWLSFVVISHHLARLLQREAQWPQFIAIWSYCSVIENTMVAIGSLPSALGVPPLVDEFCQLATIGWAFWLEWYAIKLSLRVAALTAVVLLTVDTGIGVLMAVFGS